VPKLPDELDLSEGSIREKLAGKELVIITRGTLDVVKETRDFLSSRNIAALIVDDQETPKTRGMPQRVALAVSSEDLEVVAGLLGDQFKQMIQSEGVSGTKKMEYERCPACNSLVPENAEECPECGLFIGKV